MGQPSDPVDPDVLAWVRREVTAGDPPSVKSMSQSGQGGPWLLQTTAEGRLVLHVGDPGNDDSRRGFATEVAALEAVAGAIAAPRVVAVDLTGADAGRLALLQTALEGSSRIPEAPDAERLRALGRAAAHLHGIDAVETPQLPLRLRSLAGVDLGEAVDGRTGALFAAARDAVDRLAVPESRRGLVHGDLWHGNTLWRGTAHTGTVDWDFAGVGAGGIDLGSLRCDAAVMYGAGAPDRVLEGWEEAWGGPAHAVAYWDVVAALSSPPDLAYWLPNFHAQGRRDLDIGTVTARRDDFMESALRQSA